MVRPFSRFVITLEDIHLDIPWDIVWERASAITACLATHPLRP